MPTAPRAARTAAAGEAPESYTELVAVDEATRVSWPRRMERRAFAPEPIDFEIIAWLADVRFALATQVHRRFFADRSYSTTQRRLRRMTQAGWVQRFQFFRESGASSALVYLVTDDGIAAAKHAVGPRGPYLNSRREWSAPSTEDQAMRRARHDLHVNAWVLAAERLVGDAVRSVRGPRGSHVAPPARTVAGERLAYGPSDLKLPGGRTPHSFLRTDLHRRRVDVERFRAVEPDATIEVRIQEGERRWHTDVFVELDRTFKPSKNIDKFERYDHMLAGWYLHKDRYSKYVPDPPLVVFICRDQSNARSAALRIRSSRRRWPMVASTPRSGPIRRASGCSWSPSATCMRADSWATRSRRSHPTSASSRRTATSRRAAAIHG